MTNVITIQDYDQFLEEADTCTEFNVARLDIINRANNARQTAVVIATVLNDDGDAVQYEELIGQTTDPAATLEEETQEAANNALKQLAEQTQQRRQEISQALRDRNFTVRPGVIV